MNRVFPVAALVALAGMGKARADEPSTCADGASEVIESARQLRGILEGERGRLASWRTTWVALFTGGVVGQLFLAEVVEDRRAPVYYVGALKSGLGAVTTPILSARISVPAPTGEPCADLVALKLALSAAARRQKKGVRWTQHLPGLGLNVAGIVYLGLVHDLWVESLLSAAAGTLAGSLKIITQPQRATGWSQGALPASEPWMDRVSFSAGSNHFSLTVQF